MRHHPIDVVDAEADPLQMKGGDGAAERFGFVDEARQLILLRRGLEHREQVGKAALRRLAFVSGHGGTIVRDAGQPRQSFAINCRE